MPEVKLGVQIINTRQLHLNRNAASLLLALANKRERQRGLEKDHIYMEIDRSTKKFESTVSKFYQTFI